MAVTPGGLFTYVNAPYPDYATGSGSSTGVNEFQRQVESQIEALLPGGGAGTGDFSSNTSVSVDGEIVLFSGILGKTGRRATGTGIAKLASGVLGTATPGTDYLSPTGSGLGLSGVALLNANNLFIGHQSIAIGGAVTNSFIEDALAVTAQFTSGTTKMIRAGYFFAKAEGTVILSGALSGTGPTAVNRLVGVSANAWVDDDAQVPWTIGLVAQASNHNSSGNNLTNTPNLAAIWAEVDLPRPAVDAYGILITASNGDNASHGYGIRINSVASSADPWGIYINGTWPNYFGGPLKLAGVSSGIVTIQPAGIAGTWSFTLPPTVGNSGETFINNGSGVTQWGLPFITGNDFFVGVSGQAGIAASGVAITGTAEVDINSPGGLVFLGGVTTHTDPTIILIDDGGKTINLTASGGIFINGNELAQPPFIDNVAIIKGSSDVTKLLRFEVDGFTTATTRIITPPDSDTKLLASSQFITITGPTASRTYTFPDAAATLARTDTGQTFTGTNNFGHVFPAFTDTSDLGGPTKLWRKGWLSELDAVLFAQNTASVIGGWLIIAKNEGLIPVGQDVGSGDTTIDFGQAMTLNDFVLFRAALQVEYVKVGTLVSGTRYNVTRNLDGTGANTWVAGTVYLVLGNTGNGRIELNSNTTPRISLITQGATYNAQIEMVRIGDLNGSWNISSETYGFAVGQYGVSGKSSLAIDDSGIHFYNNITERIRLLADGSAYFGNGNLAISAAGVLTVGSWTIGTTRISSANVFIDQAGQFISMGASPPTSYGNNVGIYLEGTNNGRVSFYKDANNYWQWDSGKVIWKAANSSLDANGNLTLPAGSVTARELAIGDFANLAEDPGLENGGVTGWTLGVFNIVTNASLARTGDKYLNGTVTGANRAENNLYVTCSPGDSFYAECWFIATGGGTLKVAIGWYTAAKILVSYSDGANADTVSSWTRSVIVASAPATAAYARVGCLTGGTAGWRIDDFQLRHGTSAGWSFNTSTITSTGVTLTSGATASLAFGSVPPSLATNGTGTYQDATGFFGLKTNKQTFAFTATDGVIKAGSDLSTAATTAFLVAGTAITYNSEALGAGDVLLGDNSSGKANVHWNKALGKLEFRGGTTVQAFIDTTGAITAGAGKVVHDTNGITILEGTATNNTSSIKWKSGATTVQDITGVTSSGGSFNFYSLAMASFALVTADQAVVSLAAWSHDFSKSAKLSLNATTTGTNAVAAHFSGASFTGLSIGTSEFDPTSMLHVSGDVLITGLLKAGSGPTTLTNSVGKILPAIINGYPSDATKYLDGSGAWSVPSSSGANTALSNLSSVAINAALVLGTSDAAALGSTTKQWSDLFLAEGGVINWDNGDMTITQAGDLLTIAGGNLVVPQIGLGMTPGANNLIDATGALNGNLSFQLQNTTAGTGANTRFAMKNDLGSLGQFGVYSSTTTAYGIVGSNTVYFYSNVDLAIMSDGGAIKFATGSGGPAPERMAIGSSGGVTIGSPTGGDLGAGKLNVAGDIYKNNTAFTNPDYVLEYWATSGKIERFADKDGARNYRGLMTLPNLEEFMKTNWHLPRFGQNAAHGIFSGGNSLLASLEEAYLYIFQLKSQIDAQQDQINQLMDKKQG